MSSSIEYAMSGRCGDGPQFIHRACEGGGGSVSAMRCRPGNRSSNPAEVHMLSVAYRWFSGYSCITASYQSAIVAGMNGTSISASLRTGQVPISSSACSASASVSAKTGEPMTIAGCWMSSPWNARDISIWNSTRRST